MTLDTMTAPPNGLSEQERDQLSQVNALPPPPWKPARREWLIIICCLTIGMIMALDATILVPLVPNITAHLSGTSVDALWIGTAYLVPSTVFQPFMTSLSDLFGRRSLLLTSLSLFTIGTLICCLANNIHALLAGRAVQGVGGAGCLTGTFVILSDIIPLRQRPVYLAMLQVVVAVGTATGPLIGGLFAQHTTWRWAFYINFPFCAFGLGMTLFNLRLYTEKSSVRTRLRQIDWVGATLFIGSACSFLIGVSWGGIQFSWSSWHTIVPIVLGVVGLLLTFCWEKYLAPYPFINLVLFNTASSVAAYLCIFLQGVLMGCEIYYLPLYLESVKDLSTTLAGLGLMAVTVNLMPVGALSGVVMTRTGRFRWAIWTGWVVTTISTALLLLLNTTIKTWGWILIFAALGLGHGFNIASLNICVQAFAEPANAGRAVTLYSFMRSFGMSIGVPIGGTVFQNRLKQHLRALNISTDIAKDAEGFIVQLQAISMSSPRRQTLNLAYAQSFQDTFKVLIGVAALGLVASAFLKHASMDRELETNHGLEKVAKKNGPVAPTLHSDETKIV